MIKSLSSMTGMGVSVVCCAIPLVAGFDEWPVPRSIKPFLAVMEFMSEFGKILRLNNPTRKQESKS